MSDDNKKKNIGAIWRKKSASGVDYLSISIEINGEKLNFSAFENSYKQEGDSKPDYNVAPPRDNAAAPAPAKPVAPQRQAAPQQSRGVNPAPQRAPLQGRNPAPQQKPRQAPPQDFGGNDDDNVPF